MGNVYEIECLDCGHKQEVYEGCGFCTQHLLYYCPKCDEITVGNEEVFIKNPQDILKKKEPVCKTCNTKLIEFEIAGEKEIQTSISIKCNKCKSKNIKITVAGKWD